VDAWQQEMERVMREELKRLDRPHLLAGQQAFTYGAKNLFPQDAGFTGKTFDIVNVHPLPETSIAGQVYDMGNFMSKELRLDQVARFCKVAYPYLKPTALDEDNAASMYRDTTGWTIHRKRAWTALMNGCHYDYIDFSITVGNESGTIASQRGIRSWMQHLSEFVASLDFLHAKPDTSWVADVPVNLVVSGLAVAGRDYVAYLGDGREQPGGPGAEPISGSVSLLLPAGNYDVSLYSPVTGEYSPAMEVRGGMKGELRLPTFSQDIVVRARRRAD
jgi:hypothetical protein